MGGSAMTFSIVGQMTSGKNSVVVTRSGMRFPSKRFKAWRDDVLPQLEIQRGQCAWFPLQTPITLECEYTPGDRRVRDVPGMLDALLHVIVKAGLLTDDGLVWAVTWRRNEMDRQRPGLRFTMTKQEGRCS